MYMHITLLSTRTSNMKSEVKLDYRPNSCPICLICIECVKFYRSSYSCESKVGF